MNEELKPHGWKTYLAAAGAILTGAAMIADGQYSEGALVLIGGLALVGIRGAIAKLIQTIVDKQ